MTDSLRLNLVLTLAIALIGLVLSQTGNHILYSNLQANMNRIREYCPTVHSVPT